MKNILFVGLITIFLAIISGCSFDDNDNMVNEITRNFRSSYSVYYSKKLNDERVTYKNDALLGKGFYSNGNVLVQRMESGICGDEPVNDLRKICFPFRGGQILASQIPQFYGGIPIYTKCFEGENEEDEDPLGLFSCTKEELYIGNVRIDESIGKEIRIEKVRAPYLIYTTEKDYRGPSSWFVYNLEKKSREQITHKQEIADVEYLNNGFIITVNYGTHEKPSYQIIDGDKTYQTITNKPIVQNNGFYYLSENKSSMTIYKNNLLRTSFDKKNLGFQNLMFGEHDDFLFWYLDEPGSALAEVHQDNILLYIQKSGSVEFFINNSQLEIDGIDTSKITSVLPALSGDAVEYLLVSVEREKQITDLYIVPLSENQRGHAVIFMRDIESVDAVKNTSLEQSN
jgi:hypothetical protein